jgi:hypothetical protein
MILGVVQRRPPFGNPGGYSKPVGSKNGFSGSMPSSTTAILMPSPRAPVAAQTAGAETTAGLSLVASV